MSGAKVLPEKIKRKVKIIMNTDPGDSSYFVKRDVILYMKPQEISFLNKILLLSMPVIKPVFSQHG
jgi:hypothetical protein